MLCEFCKQISQGISLFTVIEGTVLTAKTGLFKIQRLQLLEKIYFSYGFLNGEELFPFKLLKTMGNTMALRLFCDYVLRR